MLNAADLVELHEANPISLEETLDLHSRVVELSEAAPVVPRPARRRVLVAAVAVAALVAAILAATPARALVRDVLPFWDQPAAPQSVQLQFYSLDIGAPRGMNPRAVAGETRQVGRFRFGGLIHTLWVAPAKNGGFCSLWLPRGGGGCSTAGKPLSTGALLRLGAPEWITGDALASRVRDVVIRFSDGSAVHPRILWVSAPISAGFFAYEVPAGGQSAERHVSAVDAYDGQGRLVQHQTFSDAGAAG
jgi:hypothetical protein